MIVTLEIPRETHAAIRRHQAAAERADDAIADGVEAAAVTGAEVIRELLVTGELGIRPETQHPGTGLAASLLGWMIDRSIPLAAVGVPANSPAAAYARILETGGTIRPKTARALAVPVSDEARRYTSPRDMEGLTLIPRKGKPPLLVRQLARRGAVVGMEVHWVLMKSVTIKARHWLSRGVEAASDEMADAFADVIDDYVASWSGPSGGGGEATSGGRS